MKRLEDWYSAAYALQYDEAARRAEGVAEVVAQIALLGEQSGYAELRRTTGIFRNLGMVHLGNFTRVVLPWVGRGSVSTTEAKSEMYEIQERILFHSFGVLSLIEKVLGGGS